jgi:MFS family permease
MLLTSVPVTCSVSAALHHFMVRSRVPLKGHMRDQRSVLILIGRLADILGRKPAMLLALALFAFGTLLCGIAPSMKTLIAARAIAGTLVRIE